MQNKSFKFYSDAGHGWLAVKKRLLVELNIHDKITAFSYENGQTVYLEEDKDALTFIETFKAKYNCEPQIQEHHTDRSPIRSYSRYQPGVTT